MSEPDVPTTEAIDALYAERARRFAAERDRHAARSAVLSNGRLVAFAAFLAGLVGGLWDLSAPVTWALGGGGLALVAYVVLALVHDRVLRAEARAARMVALNEAARGRLARDWARLEVGVLPADRVRDPVAVDLDLFPTAPGAAALFALLGTARTPGGRDTLAGLLLDVTGADEIRARQAAVAELAPLLEWRQDLERGAAELAERQPDPGPFLAWAAGAPWLGARPWLKWIARGLAALAVLAVLAHALGLVGPLWLPLVVVNLIVAAVAGKPARAVFVRLSAGERAFRPFARLLAQLVARTPTSPRLAELHGRLSAGGHDVVRQLRRLDRLVGLADVRTSPMLHAPLNALLLWDLQVLAGLELWQAAAGQRVGDWLAVLGEVEALAALAALAHDHPGWVVPEVVTAGPATLAATGLGHPLLPLAGCVANDVTLGPPGSFLLVTGSNMSGKSTLLRAIGLNVVLARAGGPVFARTLSLPPLALGTSFRIQDSLAAGTSFFLAELERLKEVVDQARRDGAAADAAAAPLLYLLDEILLGTNVSERQVAVRRVLGHLLAHGAIGAISTHDLTLAEAAGLAEACRPVHFTESYEDGPDGPQMRFDYTLRPGVAPTKNALKLLEIVGLGRPDEGA